MRLLIINGPNLENIGIREPVFYGNKNFNQYLASLKSEFKEIELDYFQSHDESKIVEKIYEASQYFDGIIMNAGAYSHTSLVIRDAISATQIKTVLVHISNVYAREVFRHTNVIAAVCKGVITGFGLDSYKLAIQSFI